MASFDLEQGSLENQAVLSLLSEGFGMDIASYSARERHLATWRYLKWHRIRLAEEPRNVRAKLDRQELKPGLYGEPGSAQKLADGLSADLGV